MAVLLRIRKKSKCWKWSCKSNAKKHCCHQQRSIQSNEDYNQKP